MIARCTNSKLACFHYYGGRGIIVCVRWKESFMAFLSDMGERPLGATLDRIDNDGDYEPGNCRWATPNQQAANRRPPRPVDWRTTSLHKAGMSLSECLASIRTLISAPAQH
jgi:hypothetical protein